MPNWMYNGVSIHTDTKEELDALIEALAKPSEAWYTEIGSDEPTRKIVEQPFNFFNVIRPPEETLVKGGDYWNSSLTSGWYEWNTTNWGVKWNAHEVSIDRFSDTTVDYRFLTAWTMPRGIINALPKVFPNIRFSWYGEEENGWGESWEFDKGWAEPALMRTWEVPQEEEEEEVEV